MVMASIGMDVLSVPVENNASGFSTRSTVRAKTDPFCHHNEHQSRDVSPSGWIDASWSGDRQHGDWRCTHPWRGRF